MSSREPEVAPAHTVDVAKLQAFYDKHKLTAERYEADEQPERSRKDPFGHDEKRDTLTSVFECVERMVKFTRLLGSEFRLNPKSMVFMAHLYWLNVMRAEDNPLTPEEITKIQDIAQKHYERHRR